MLNVSTVDNEDRTYSHTYTPKYDYYIDDKDFGRDLYSKIGRILNPNNEYSFKQMCIDLYVNYGIIPENIEQAYRYYATLQNMCDMLDKTYVESRLDDWLKEEGIYHETRQEAFKRILAWQNDKSAEYYPYTAKHSLNRVLSGYKAKLVDNLYQQSYGVLVRLFDKVQGK